MEVVSHKQANVLNRTAVVLLSVTGQGSPIVCAGKAAVAAIVAAAGGDC